MSNKKTITILSPVYNESEGIEIFYRALKKEVKKISSLYDISILFVADKGSDDTFLKLEAIAKEDHSVSLIFLSSRFGHQMSLVAGIDHSYSDAIIMMDCDLQHPPELIPELLKSFDEGYDIVFTIRNSPKDNNFLKIFGSNSFYKLMSLIGEIQLAPGEADYRLISSKVAEVFRTQIRERNQFLRGLFNWVGFKRKAIYFDSSSREIGKSKYNFSRMISFAFQGIVSFSKKPLQYAIFMGLTLSVLSVLLILYLIYAYFISEEIVSGFTTLAVLVSFFGGINLLFLGIIGEYIGSIFDEVKSRPLYLVEEFVNFDKNESITK